MALQRSTKRLIAKGMVMTNLAGVLVALHYGLPMFFISIQAAGLIGSMVAHEFNAG
jgi:hypothetical protein